MQSASVALPQTDKTPVSSTDLAIQRTRLAFERTTMAWIRTSISLISFGFTIYKFFDLFKKEEVTSRAAVFGPRRMALFMISIGLLALVVAVIERWNQGRSLPGAGLARYSLATIVAALVGIMGVLTFLAVFLRQ